MTARFFVIFSAFRYLYPCRGGHRPPAFEVCTIFGWIYDTSAIAIP